MTISRLHRALLTSVMSLLCVVARGDVVVPGPPSTDTRDMLIGGSLALTGVIGIIAIRTMRRAREK